MKKKSVKHEEKNINMAEHEMRLRTLGISERARRLILRFSLILIFVMLVIYWFIKTRS